MLLLNAAAISEVLRFPAQGTSGQVKSVHCDYVNILTSDGMIALVRSGMDHIPFGVEVDLVGGWLDTGLKEQQEVLLLADSIIVGENLTVRGLHSCRRFSCQYSYDSLSGAVECLPRLRCLQKLCDDANKADGILAYIGQYDAEMFCRRRPPLVESKIPQLIKRLIIGILENNEYLISEGICGLLGVGPGSTPSGDDFLLGFLSGIVHVQLEHCKQATETMTRHLVCNAPSLTTFMSVEYIKYGVKGLYHQRFGDMIRSFSTGTEQEIINKAYKLMQLGHFSGVDLLVGFVYGGFTALAAGTIANEKGVSK